MVNCVKSRREIKCKCRGSIIWQGRILSECSSLNSSKACTKNLTYGHAHPLAARKLSYCARDPKMKHQPELGSTTCVNYLDQLHDTCPWSHQRTFHVFIVVMLANHAVIPV